SSMSRCTSNAWSMPPGSSSRATASEWWPGPGPTSRIASPGFGARASTTSARVRKGRGISSTHRCAYGHGTGRRRSEITNAAAIPPAAAASFRRSTSREYRPSGEQGQVRLALAPQYRQVDLDAVDPARLREHPRLRLDHLGGKHPAAGAHPGLGPD